MNMIMNHDAQELIRQHANITAVEIEHQPAVWRELCASLDNDSACLSAFVDRVLAVPGIRIIFTGAGSSAFIGESMSMLLKRERGLRSETIHTTDIVATPDEIWEDVPTLLVSYSRSGSSPESMGAIQCAQKHVHELYNLVIVCNPDSKLAKMDLKPDMTKFVCIPSIASDQGFAMTCSVSCMALATWFLFAEPDKRSARLSSIRNLADSCEKQIPALQQAAARIAQIDYDRIIFLGFGALHGLAHEASLKSQELTFGRTVSTHDTPTGFRHGPKTILNGNALMIQLISTAELSQKYDVDMLREMVDNMGKERVYAVVAEQDADRLSVMGSQLITYAPAAAVENKELCAYLYGLLFVQILSFEKSLALGVTTDNPCPHGEVNRVVQGVTIYLD